MTAIHLPPAGTPIGLLAAWGRYPLVVAAVLRARGYRVVCLGVRDHVDPAIIPLCDAYREIGAASLGAAIRFFKRHGVRLATMAGKFHKTVLFQRFNWVRHFPDWRFVRTFFPHFITLKKDRKDDTMLLAIVEAHAADGIAFAPATDFIPELLVKFGVLNGSLNRTVRADIEFGWRVAKELGRLDVGQTVVVKKQAVLALEAVEGTDACIRRAGELCTQGGFVVVKVAKPRQDMRFDVPTIGVGTIETIARAGGAALAIEADKTILIDEAEVRARARQLGVTLVAATPERLDELVDQSLAQAASEQALGEQACGAHAASQLAADGDGADAA